MVMVRYEFLHNLHRYFPIQTGFGLETDTELNVAAVQWNTLMKDFSFQCKYISVPIHFSLNTSQCNSICLNE